MGFFRRTDDRTPPTPRLMLSRAGVAERVGRSPGRISRLHDQGVLPTPEYTDHSGQPYWSAETIDSWWAAREGFTGDDAPRYHRQFRVVTEPLLLDNTVIEHDLGHRAEQFHVRTYRGVDGNGPVVLISPLRGDRVPIDDNAFGRVARQYAAISTHELEYQANTVWFLAVTGSWKPFTPSRERLYPPPQVEVYDLTEAADSVRYNKAAYALRRVSPVTAADVARIIGRPFDVFPEEHYTRDTITTRAPWADSLTATQIETDDRDLGTLISELNALAAAVAADHNDPALLFAAHAVADNTVTVDAQVRDSTRYLQLAAALRGVADSTATLLPVEPRPRFLNISETNLVHRYRPTPPLIGERRKLFADNSPDVHHIHPDTAEMYRAVGDYLDRTALTPPLLDALTHAHQLLSEALRAGDPDRWRPTINSVGSVRMTLHRGVALDYRNWSGLTTVTDDSALTPGQRRRLEALTTKASRHPVVARFYDHVNDLFVVETVHERNDYEPNRWPNELVFEWPYGQLRRDDLTPDATIVQPTTRYGDSTPAWLRTTDTWTPIPSDSDGFTWGTESPRHSLGREVIRAAFVYGGYLETEEQHDLLRSLEHTLDTLLIGDGPDDLTVPAADITALVEDFIDTITTPITTPTHIATRLDAATAIAADSGWLIGRHHGWIFDNRLGRIAYSIDTLADAMHTAGWLPDDDTTYDWASIHAQLPHDHHERYMRLIHVLLSVSE